MRTQWKENSHLIVILVCHLWWFPSWYQVLMNLSPGNICKLKILEITVDPFVWTSFRVLMITKEKIILLNLGRIGNSTWAWGRTINVFSWATIQKQICLWLEEMDHGEAKIWSVQGSSRSSGSCVAYSGFSDALHSLSHSHCKSSGTSHQSPDRS